MDDYMLTTEDNPFDPFENFNEWFAWDASTGYHTPGLLARIAKTSNDLSEADQALAIDYAMDEIIEVFGSPYKKVKRKDVVAT